MKKIVPSFRDRIPGWCRGLKRLQSSRGGGTFLQCNEDTQKTIEALTVELHPRKLAQVQMPI